MVLLLILLLPRFKKIIIYFLFTTTPFLPKSAFSREQCRHTHMATELTTCQCILQGSWCSWRSLGVVIKALTEIPRAKITISQCMCYLLGVSCHLLGFACGEGRSLPQQNTPKTCCFSVNLLFCSFVLLFFIFIFICFWLA